MANAPIFEWHAKAYTGEEKSTDWYWALGIFALALVVVCILFGNILLALVVIAATITLFLHAAKRPRIHRFAITDHGLTIDNRHYDFKDMLHYSVLEYLDESIPPALSIKTKHFLAPHLHIPIIGYNPIDIYNYMAIHLPEGNHDESIVDRLVELIEL